MAAVCQKCGATGIEQLLVFCDKCQVSAEHRYCLDGGPKPEQELVNWVCEQCIMEVPKNDNHHVSTNFQRQKYLRREEHTLNKDHYLQKIYSTKLPKDMYGDLCFSKNVHNTIALSKKSKLANDGQGHLSLQSGKDDVQRKIEESEHLSNEGEGRRARKMRGLILDDESDEDAPPSSGVNLTREMPCRKNDGSEHVGNDGECRKMRKKRSLILHDESDEDVSPSSSNKYTDGMPCRRITQDKVHLPGSCDHSSSTSQPDKPLPQPATNFHRFPVSPVVHAVWRGFFSICDRKYGPIVAHLSNGACEKACNASNMLPQILHFERLPRLEAWPKSFVASSPTVESIALYFFPGDVRAKAVFEQMLGDIIREDLTLKVTVHKAELLVFSSKLLPHDYHLFEGEPYLWGVFRRRQFSLPPVSPETRCPRVSEASGHVDNDQPYHIAEDKRTSDGFKGDDDKKGINEPQAPCGLVPSELQASKAPGHLVSDRYISLLSSVTEENHGGSKASCSMGRGSRDHLSSEFPHFLKAINMSETGTFNKNIMKFEVSGEYRCDEDNSLESYLELFPLRAENLGITAKVKCNNEITFELGLGMVKDRRCEFKPALE